MGGKQAIYLSDSTTWKLPQLALLESSREPSPATMICRFRPPALTRVVTRTASPCSSSALLQPSASSTMPAATQSSS